MMTRLLTEKSLSLPGPRIVPMLFATLLCPSMSPDRPRLKHFLTVDHPMRKWEIVASRGWLAGWPTGRLVSSHGVVVPEQLPYSTHTDADDEPRGKNDDGLKADCVVGYNRIQHLRPSRPRIFLPAFTSSASARTHEDRPLAGQEASRAVPSFLPLPFVAFARSPVLVACAIMAPGLPCTVSSVPHWAVARRATFLDGVEREVYSTQIYSSLPATTTTTLAPMDGRRAQ